MEVKREGTLTEMVSTQQDREPLYEGGRVVSLCAAAHMLDGKAGCCMNPSISLTGAVQRQRSTKYSADSGVS